ncbi:hypothetical protein PLESTB_000811100 [Pleodorina starrii]|uniref:Kinesin motor domain-containing protein n=1 Tax=Pleodorina starrii TaxID=330485 RepID=A0A9W6BKL1_9CHLO|nr:hypothetical protein PLESTB_000811100 [Pleodorina starrii]
MRLQIRESMEGGVLVVGLSEVVVRSAAEALQLLRVGTSHRAVAETASNSVSSRSHCILTLHMEAKDKLDTGVVRIRRSRLQLVDLAGSERSTKGVESGSVRQKETNAINKSLSTLGLVISRLTDRTRSQGPVPYRDSKLTFLLQDCLGGNAKTLIIANLNPSPTCSAETNMTLGFALRAKRVRNRAVVNEDHQGDAVVLQGEVRRLREELSIFRTIHAKDGPPKGIEALSAWRDEAAARVSQLHQALQLNGELEDKLAEMEAAHSRLRMEHLALEEQCDAMRTEMSALEATVEQCEDELHELRERPTMGQLQDVEEQLHLAICERDDARAQLTDVEEQNLQLHEQCLQLSGLLQTYQNRELGADQAEQSYEHMAGFGNEPGDQELVGTVPRSDYVALQLAYAQLKQSYDSLVEQSHQLLSQHQAAVCSLEEASVARAEEASVEHETGGPQRRQQHRYYLADSCLVSGGLEAVIEAVDEEYDGECGDERLERQAQAAPAEADSPSEQVRLASPASLGGGSATADSTARLSPVLPSTAHCAEQSVDVSNQMRRRCRSQGSGHDAPAGDKGVAEIVVLRRSAPGSPLDSHRSCDSAPPSFSLTNIRQLGRLACSGLQCEVSGAILEEDGSDAAETRSLGTLVRVNPLFECRNGEERLPTAERAEACTSAEKINSSTQAPKCTGSAEAPVGSDLLVCELPMPPEAQLAQESPRPQGTFRSADSSDSTAGIVREGSGGDGQAAKSVLSDARDRALHEIQSPNTLVITTSEPRHGKINLQADPSLTATPCSHPVCADAERASGATPRSRGVDAAKGLSSPVFKFDGFGGASNAPMRSASRANSVSRATRSALRSSSPLLTFSIYNDENACAPYSSIAGPPQGSCGKLLRSPCVTGVSGPPALGLRPSQPASCYSRGRSRDATHGVSTVSQSANTSAREANGCGQRGFSAGLVPGGALDDVASRGSPVTEQRADPSRLHEDQLVEGALCSSMTAPVAYHMQRAALEVAQENIAQLEEELGRRLQGEMHLRMKLQEALTDAQSAKTQAANLLALNSGLIEEVQERDERLRCFEDLVARLYGEMKTILRQGLHELATPVQHARAGTARAASPSVCTPTGDDEAAAVTVHIDSDPATASPTERPRLKQSYETGPGSPFSFGADATPQYSIPAAARFPAQGSAAPSPMQSGGSRDVELVPSPLGLIIGSVQVEGPNSAMKMGLMLLLAKLRDGLWERDQHVATLEAELVEARLRLQHLEQENQKLQEACQHGASRPTADDEAGRTNQAANTGAVGPIDTVLAIDGDRIDEHGFIAPPSPAGSDSDPHLPAPWSASVDQTSQSSPPGSSTRREASLQAQLQSRDIQVFELLERNEQLEASLQAATTDRDSRVAELQTHATRLANSLQAQLWKRDAQVTDLQNQVVDLDASLQRATAEAVRYRQQCMETVEQCERYALELRGLERREELLMNKLRTLEMSLMHRGQEVDGLRAELANTTEQLAGMRDKAMAAEVDAAHARQAAASLEDQLEDLRRNIRLAQQPLPPSHRQQPPVSHYVATVRPTGVSAGGAAPGAWPPGQGPYLNNSRSDGGAVGSHAMTYQAPGLAPAEFGPMVHDVGHMTAGARPLGHFSRNAVFGQVAPPAAPIKPMPNQGLAKGGASRVHGSAPVATGAALDHAANKGTWVQRFLCRKNVSVDGSPGQAEHVAILTPAKWRTKGMTGIVLRQWVSNASGKTASRKAG